MFWNTGINSIDMNLMREDQKLITINGNSFEADIEFIPLLKALN